MGGSFTGADVLISLVFLVSSLAGLLRGFVREAVALGFWIVGVWAAWAFGPRVEPYLGGYLAGPAVRPWVGRLVVLVAVLFVSFGVGVVLNFFMRGSGLGLIDRVIGLMFGMARGMVLVGLLVISAELLHLNHESWWSRSTLIPYCEALGDWLRALVGERGEPWAKLERLTGVKIR
jgi:membrane protein required for colicin V production